MLCNKLKEGLSQQIAKEWYSAYFYMSMVSYFEIETLPGFSKWMRIQAQEELAHGQIFFNYLSQHAAPASLGEIKAPPAEFKSPLDVFKKGLEHEKLVTASIYKLVDGAISEKDYATQRFLDWFVNEQHEEETNFQTVVGKLERIKGSSEGLFMLDNELSTRVFVMPAPLAAQP